MRRSIRALMIGVAVAAVGVGVQSGGAMAATPRWAADVVAQPADGKGARNSLIAIDCTEDQVCTGVGAYFAGNVRAADLVTTTNGHVTSVVRAPLPADADPTKSSYLADVSCWAPGACVAVGWYTPRSGVGLLVETLADGTWTPLRAPVPAGTAIPKLAAVDCNATSCVATGLDSVYNTQPVLLVRAADGTWTAPPVSEPTGTQHLDLTLPTCPPSGPCVASGHAILAGPDQAELFAYPSGSGWTTIYYPHPDNANPATLTIGGMSCPATSNCFALGSYFDIAVRRYKIVRETLDAGVLKAHVLANPAAWDGATWSGADISCWTTTDCVGYVDSDQGAVMYRLRGTAWSVVTGPTDDFAFQDVDCSTIGTCTAVGATTAGQPGEATYSGGDGTWLPQTFSASGLAHHADGGAFMAVSCVDHICTAGGALTSSTDWQFSRAIRGVGKDLPGAAE